MLALTAVALAFAVSACLPPNPGPTGLYLGKQSNITPKVTPKAQPITWGAAPAIDANYGGRLYVGTSIEMADPRPPLRPGGLEPLRLWVADPNNGVTSRPAIVWLHGGGFAVGIDSMYGLANGVGREYAQRGYVGFSVEYRTDTTLVGTQQGAQRPPSLCQWVQDNVSVDDPVWLARRDQCIRDINAAQYDALAAIRWIRLHATEYGVDPNRIAVGGFSAGAVTASNVAYQSDEVGTVSYFAGDDRAPSSSKAQAAFGSSGCTYTPDGTAPTSI
jgi:acetyl esterase/lipase